MKWSDIPASTCGIYQIKNRTTHKVYIGSSARIAARLQNHLSTLNRGVHDNIHLQRAFIKYGKDAFECSVLETTSVDCLVEREQYQIDSVPRKLLYNVRFVAESNHGIKFSAATRKKMSEDRKGRLFVSAEAILKRCKPYPSFISPEGTIFPSSINLSGFCRTHGLNTSHMRLLVKGKQKTSKGWMLLSQYEANQAEPPVKPFRKDYSYQRKSEADNKTLRDYPDVISPEGETIAIGRNLNTFCRKYNLSAEQLRRVISGERGRVHHKGWRVNSPNA